VRWALGAASALLVTAAAVAAVLVLASPSKGGSPLVVAWHAGYPADCVPTRLMRVDPATLRPKGGRTLRLKGYFKQPVRSPDAKTVALGGSAGTILLADVSSMRRRSSIRIGSPYEDTTVVSWPAADRLVALDVSSDAHRVGLTKVVVVDPKRGDVVREARFPWWAAQGRGTTAAGRVATLIVSWQRLVPPRLVVVTADGTIEIVTLARLRAGVGYSHGEVVRFPALAVDPQGERAFVINEGEPVAIVDLATLKVRYQRATGLSSPARALAGPAHETGTSNPRSGPARSATWLGGGLIAISGSDSYTGQAGRWLGDSKAPAGLQILDTRSWRARTLDRRPSEFEWIRGRLVATARAWNPRARRVRGDALVAYDRAGRVKYRIPGDRKAHWQAFDGRLFVDDGPSPLLAVLDARDGRKLGCVSANQLYAVLPGYC
jgi:hypothetical protein